MANKKILIAIMALTLFVQMGCTSVDKQKGSNDLDNGSKVEQGQNEETKADEKEIVAQLSEIVKSKEKLKEAIEFMNNNTPNVSKETASKMVYIFEEAQKGYLTTIEDKYYNEGIQEKFQNLDQSMEDINELKDINDEAIKELVAETKSLSYKIETAEGSYFPIIDYSFLKKYSTYVTDDMKEYIEIMSVESDVVPAKDAGLIITWDALLDRALNQENFINEYKDSAKLNYVQELYNKYLYFVFNGLDNTPLFDFSTKTMTSKAKTSYLAAIENKDGSNLLEELDGYMEVLKGTGYKLTDAVQKYREDAIKRLTEGK